MKPSALSPSSSSTKEIKRMKTPQHPPGLASVAGSRQSGEALTNLGGLLSIAASNPYSQGLMKSDENHAVTKIEKAYKSSAESYTMDNM